MSEVDGISSLTPDEIRGIRESFGLSQAAFEAALGLGPKTVVRWETGKVTPSRASTLLLVLLRRYPDALAHLRGQGQEAPDPHRGGLGDARDLIGQLLAHPAGVVELERVVSRQIREAIGLLAAERFPLDHQDVSEESLRRRLLAYEAAVQPLLGTCLQLGRWGREEHLPLLERLLRHLLGQANRTGGYLIWIGLQWYPLNLLYYAAGVAAISSRNWRVIERLYDPEPFALPDRSEARSLADHVVHGITEYGEPQAAFKAVPGMAQKRFPMSEAVFELLQKPVEDTLYLDSASYERCFDQFEVLRAAQFAAGPLGKEPRGGGPPGRFAWKLGRGDGGPLPEFEEFLERLPANHPLLYTGSFRRGREEVKQSLKELRGRLGGAIW